MQKGWGFFLRVTIREQTGVLRGGLSTIPDSLRFLLLLPLLLLLMSLADGKGDVSGPDSPGEPLRQRG